MKIAICDDEKIFLEKISSVIRNVAIKYNKNCNILKYNDGETLINYCKKENVDAVFLDISMPGIDGFETADTLIKLKNNIIIIFVSSNEGMVFSSYEYKPFWFVPKSQICMLESVIDKLFIKLENEENKNIDIVINIEANKVIKINLNEVTYFKTNDHYIKIFYKDRKESNYFRNKLNNIRIQLMDKWFVRVHNRYLVNCRMISTIGKNECVLINGEHIPVSRTNMENTKECFQNYLRSLR